MDPYTWTILIVGTCLIGLGTLLWTLRMLKKMGVHNPWNSVE